jgi:hypothetical protein
MKDDLKNKKTSEKEKIQANRENTEKSLLTPFSEPKMGNGN